MTETWENISWIFEPDGAWRDIYVQDITIDDWEKLIDFLNANFTLSFNGNCPNQIDKDYIVRYLNDKSGKLESRTLIIKLNRVSLFCHFFLPDQIEFDLDPQNIESYNDFKKVEEFMLSVSTVLKSQVTLTFENDIKYPLIKIDVINGINKVLTQQEFKAIIKNSYLLKDCIRHLETGLIMRLFPKKYKNRILKSATETYRSTKKSDNAW